MRTARQTQRDARELFRLCLVGGALDDGRARQVVDLVIASGRHGTSALLAALLRRIKLERARRSAVVSSAAPLDERTRAAIEAGLRQRYGAAIDATFDVDPRLIAGTRVTIGSDVYDSSVKARLAALEGRF